MITEKEEKQQIYIYIYVFYTKLVTGHNNTFYYF